MTKLDDKLPLKAYRAIQKYGKDVIFTKAKDGLYDPDAGVVMTTGVESNTVKVSPPQKYKASYADGETRRQAQSQLTLPAHLLTFTPTTDYQVVFDGLAFEIVDLDTVYSGDLIAAYEVFIRR